MQVLAAWNFWAGRENDLRLGFIMMAVAEQSWGDELFFWGRMGKEREAKRGCEKLKEKRRTEGEQKFR